MDRALQARPFRGTARFEIRRQLGAGGTGVVYEAFDRERNAPVALKTLIAFTPEALARFKNEFRSLQDLEHPNLVRLDELMEEGGTWFFTMELIDGVDFLRHVRATDSGTIDPAAIETATAARVVAEPQVDRTLLTDEAPAVVPGGIAAPRRSLGFDEARLRDALRQLVVGIAALHDAGKIHRDIKPGNVLVTGEGRVVILDFGLIANPGRLETRAVGTVNYMAPEQAAAMPIGPAADWYAVGVTLYRALTGAVPFAGTAQEIMQQKVDLDPRPPSTVVKGIPADLDALCLQLLQRDPARRPTGRAILARLGAALPSAPASAPAITTFVGRAGELEVLEAALADSRDGAVTVLVHGESGVGKSALVRRFVDDHVARGAAVVLSSRCYERESVPYKAVDQAMEALARHLAEMPAIEVLPLLPERMALVADIFPAFLQIPAVTRATATREVRLTEPTQARAYAFAALRLLLARLGRRSPLVLAIDDLQWADGDSLALLAELLTPVDAPPMLLCATVRVAADAADALIDGLRPHLGAQVRTIAVEGLPLAAARELAETLFSSLGATASGASTGRLGAEQIAEEAAGHPMFIDALVRHRVTHPDSVGPVRLDEALLARIAALEPEARRVLTFVCIAGGPVQQEACAHAAGVPFGEFAPRVHTLRVASLVRTLGIRRADTVEPYHDRVREAVAEQLAPDERREIHARLARALEASGQDDPEALAVHFRAAGDLRRAARYAARAADRAQEALAFQRAVELYRLALELDTVPSHHQRLRIRLAEALASCGRGKESAEEFLAAADGAGPDEAIELRRQAAAQYLRSGRPTEGVQTMEAVLATVGMHLPTTRGGAVLTFLLERLRLRLRGLRFQPRAEEDAPPDLLRAVQVCFSVYPLGMTDTLRGHPFQMRNLRLSLDLGVPGRIVRALAPNMIFEATAGERGAAAVERLHALARQLTAEVGDPYLQGVCDTGMGACNFLLGRWRVSVEQCDRAERILREQCTGAAWELDAAQIYAMRSLFFTGGLAEIARRMPGALKEARDRGDLYLATYLRTGLPMSHLWLAKDDPGTARWHSTEAMSEWSYEGTHLQHVHALQGEMSIDLYTGDVDAAERRMAEWWPRLSKAMYLRIRMTRLVYLHLRGRIALAAARGADDERLAAAARDAREIVATKESWAQPLAALLQAGIAARRGDAAAAGLLETAEAGLDAADMPLFAAAARWQRGALLGGDAGAALVAAAEAWMRGEGIARPERFADLLVPGFGRAG